MLALVLLGTGIVQQVNVNRSAARTSAAVDATLSIQELIHYLQRERGLTNGLLGGATAYRDDVDAERKNADKALAKVRSRIKKLDLAELPGVESAVSALDGLEATRRGVDAGSAVKALTFTWYTDRIKTLNQLDLGLSGASDGQLSDGANALRALGDAKEASARMRGFLNGIFAAKHFAPGEYATFASARAERDAALATFRRYATPEERSRGDAALKSPAAAEAAGYEKTAVAAYDGRRLTVKPSAWWDSMTTVVDDMRAAQLVVGNDISDRANSLHDRATMFLAALAGVALVAIIGGIALAIVAARSISRPLALIAAEADDVASRRLPDAVAIAQSANDDVQQVPPPRVQVPQRATTEMRSMAAALDRVQNTAYSLAAEQAVLRRNTTESLANLGRRNQNLLRRQLGFISRLEGEEADPTALANLFELDHLATRMRRNAESLLVLVGEVSPRRWSAPVALADVIRAAISEVEEYRRVALRRIDDSFLAGACVAEVAHILAELLENALSFSPPDADVELYGRRMRDKYLIAIVDHGVGMTSAELATANARLRGDQSFLLVPTRFLGHYVVGALARRLGVEVELNPSPVTGVTARVTVPAALMAELPSVEASPVPAPTSPAPRQPVRVPSEVAPPHAVDSSTAELERVEIGAFVPAAQPAPNAYDSYGQPTGDVHGRLAAGDDHPQHAEPRPGPAGWPADPNWPVDPNWDGVPERAAERRSAGGFAPVPGRWVLGQRGGHETGPAAVPPPSVNGYHGVNGLDVPAPAPVPRQPLTPTPQAYATPPAHYLPPPTQNSTLYGQPAAMPAAPPPRPSGPPVPVAQSPQDQNTHTRNGLTKRVRRGGKADTATNGGAWLSGPDHASPALPDRAPSVDRAPSEVGVMLTSFRAGMQQGARRPTSNGISGMTTHAPSATDVDLGPDTTTGAPPAPNDRSWSDHHTQEGE